MKNLLRWLILAPVLLASVPSFADSDLSSSSPQEKQQLDSARQDYQQAVKQYGEQSPQAQDAKSHLRESRTAYHNAIRMRQRAGLRPRSR